MKHYNIKVYGRVQGVFYRESAKKIARYLGLRGFVENTMEGAVYIEVEGVKSQVDKFVIWCKIGSDIANVREIKINESEIKNFHSFEIKY